MQDPDSDCVLWTSAIIENGYGVIRIAGKYLYAHRMAYGLVHGSIHDGLVIDHTCFVKHCVNPDHLEAVTQGENVQRSWDRKLNIK